MQGSTSLTIRFLLNNLRFLCKSKNKDHTTWLVKKNCNKILCDQKVTFKTKISTRINLAYCSSVKSKFM